METTQYHHFINSEANCCVWQSNRRLKPSKNFFLTNITSWKKQKNPPLDLFQSLKISDDDCTFPLNGPWVSSVFMCFCLFSKSQVQFVYSFTQQTSTPKIPQSTYFLMLLGILELVRFLLGTTNNLHTFWRWPQEIWGYQSLHVNQITPPLS